METSQSKHSVVLCTTTTQRVQWIFVSCACVCRFILGLPRRMSWAMIKCYFIFFFFLYFFGAHIISHYFFFRYALYVFVCIHCIVISQTHSISASSMSRFFFLFFLFFSAFHTTNNCIEMDSTCPIHTKNRVNGVALKKCYVLLRTFHEILCQWCAPRCVLSFLETSYQNVVVTLIWVNI